MKSKKNILIILLFVVFGLANIILINKTAAIEAPPIEPGILEKQFTTATGAGLSSKDFPIIAKAALGYLLEIIGILAVVGFVIAGIMYITAAGDEDRVEKAKQMLTYSIIGIVVALLGLVIVTAVNYTISGG